MNSIKKLIPWLQASAVDDGVTITPNGTLRVQGDSATLLYASGGRHLMTMQTSSSGGICVRVESSETKGLPGEEPLVTEQQFALSMAHKARDVFQGRIAEWRRTLGASHRRRWPAAISGFLAGALFVIFGSMMLSSGGAGQVGAGETAANPAAGLLPRPDLAALAAAGGVSQPPMTIPGQRQPAGLDAVGRSGGEQVAQARLTAQELALVKKATSIKLTDGAKVLTAFSDPLCPACQDLDRQAARMGPGHGFAVIPVAYQNGSRNLVASILCSADPAKAWTASLIGERPSAPACDAGLKQVDANNELFSRIGASATPTVIAPNGQLAQGSADTPELVQFLAAFAK